MVRHGEIPSNVKKIYAGKSPEGLNKTGLAQAKEVSEKLRCYSVGALYTSPISRALQTAKIIAEAIGIDVTVEEAFREMEFGPWEGLSENNITKYFPEKWQIWQSRPAELKLDGRETLEDLQERSLKGIQKIYENNGNRVVVLVTHVAIIRVLLLWHRKMSLNLYKTINVPNAEIFEIIIENFN